MSFSTTNMLPNSTSNGFLMDTDKASIEESIDIPVVNPTDTLSDSWIPKDYSGSDVSVTGTGFTTGNGKLTFTPCQVVSNKGVEINVHGHYEATYSGTIGGMGQTEHSVSLGGITSSGSFVNLKSVQIICSVDDQGVAVTACLVPPEDGIFKSNAVTFRSINWDADSATATRTFKVYIDIVAEVSNSSIAGLGQLFPVVN